MWSKLKVINIGLKAFARDLESQGIEVVEVDFRPPSLDKELLNNLRKLPIKIIEEANNKVIDIILSAKPNLWGMGRASEIIPGFGGKFLLHAGPPITWDRMCGPLKGAIIGAILYEGWTSKEKDAWEMASSGDIRFEPTHHYHAVGPMAGVISPSMPVFIIKNNTFGNMVYVTQNEGLGKALRFGAYSQEVIERLKWMENVLYPVLSKAIDELGDINLKNVMSQALHMGDELHNRNRAATSLFFRIIAPSILHVSRSVAEGEELLKFIDSNDHFFLNLAMGASKSCLEPAERVDYSSIVNVIARNGTDFGIRVSGLDKEWFVSEAAIPDVLFFPGYTEEDANPDLGDSAIMETLGLGGFALASAPAIVQFIGGTPKDAMDHNLDMYEITHSLNEVFTIPYLNFRGTPLGIDILKVIKTGITPILNTGVAHKNPGVGQVGAGIIRLPITAFEMAGWAFVRKYGSP